MQIEWGMIVLVAVAVVGDVEWIKARAAGLPSWVWWIVSPILAFGLFALRQWAPWAVLGAAALALAQLGYQVIVQGIPELIKALIGKAGSQ